MKVVRTVAETQVFAKYAADVWSTVELEEFIGWIAANPWAGDVIPGSGGCRKVRWASSGRGKRSGARIIYAIAQDGTVWLLIVYTKAKFDNLPPEVLTRLKREISDG